MEKKALAIFGGSFNPPLNSHFSLAEEIVNEMENVEKLIFVPVSKQYNKPGLASNEDRYNMLKLVCDKDEMLEVSNIEHIQKEQLNSYFTIELLQEQYPEYEILFVIGTDNLKELYWWGHIDDFLAKYKMIVIERGTDKMDDIIETQEFLKKYRDRFIRYNQQIRTNLSSTYVRGKIKEGKNVKYLMPEEVHEYIKNKGLYKN